MLVNGLAKFCDDIELDAASFEVLLICWKFKAAVQCEFTRKEFTDGMVELGLVVVYIDPLTLDYLMYF